MDPLLGVIPSGPVSAQLAVSFLQVLFIEGRLSQAVNVGLDADVIEVPQFCVDEGAQGELSVEPVEVALT